MLLLHVLTIPLVFSDANEIDWEAPTLGFVRSVPAANVSKLSKRQYVAPKGNGPILVDIEPHSPAAVAGIRALDQVDRFNGERIETPEELQARIARLKDGEEVALEIVRPNVVKGKLTWNQKKKGTLKSTTERNSAMSAVREMRDKVEDITWVYHKDSPSPGSESDCELYFAIKDGKPGPLRLRVYFRGKSWVFMRRFVVRADGVRFEIPADPFPAQDILRDGILEKSDLPVSAKDFEALTAVGAAQDVVWRYEGPERQADRNLESPDRARIRQMIRAYRAFGGKPPE
jgi:hypothetical protein